MSIFRSKNSVTLEPIEYKFDACDYVDEITSYANFYKIQRHKGYPAIWWNVHLAYFLNIFIQEISWEALQNRATVGNLGS